jgi:hypothetical protein
VSPGGIIVKQQVLQLGQNVVAFSHVISLKKNSAVARALFPISLTATTAKPYAHQFKRVKCG